MPAPRSFTLASIYISGESCFNSSIPSSTVCFLPLRCSPFYTRPSLNVFACSFAHGHEPEQHRVCMNLPYHLDQSAKPVLAPLPGGTDREPASTHHAKRHPDDLPARAGSCGVTPLPKPVALELVHCVCYSGFRVRVDLHYTLFRE